MKEPFTTISERWVKKLLKDKRPWWFQVPQRKDKCPGYKRPRKVYRPTKNEK